MDDAAANAGQLVTSPTFARATRAREGWATLARVIPRTCFVALCCASACGSPRQDARVIAAPPPASAPAPAAASASSAPTAATDDEPPLSRDEVDAQINPTHLPDYHGPTGVVEGAVYVTGEPAAPTTASFTRCPLAAAMFGKKFREGPPTAGGKRPLADAAVGITGYSGFVVRPRRPVEIVSIDGCGMFDSRTVVLTFGQDLLVQNRGSEAFAPFLVQAAGSTRVAPPGATLRIRPRKPGAYELADAMGHVWMHANVFVAMSSLHAVTDELGHFRIEGVPVGTLRLSAVHPALKSEAATTVEIRQGETTTAELTLTNASRPR